MKKLYIMIQYCGDGSYYPKYTMDDNVVAALQEANDNDETTWPSLGCDGDGFHYETLNIPDECTYESLGIHVHLTMKDVEEILSQNY